MRLFTKLTLVALLALTPWSTSIGGDAQRAYKEGKELDEAGQDYRAALKYIDALDAKPDHKKAIEGLLACAKDAYVEQLGTAEDAETGKRWATALDEYRALNTLGQRIELIDGPKLRDPGLPAKIDLMATNAAEEQYLLAEQALGGTRYESAIGLYRQAQKYKPAYKDSQAKISDAAYRWGESSLGTKLYRESAGHFELAAAEAGGAYKDARTRAGKIYAALGKAHIKPGECRQAVRDLRTAKGLDNATAPAEDMTAAEACAVTPVAILAFENPTGVNIAGIAIGDSVADETTMNVAKGASEYVKLLERSAFDRILTEQGITAVSAAAAPGKLTGVRFLVIGKITQVKLERVPVAAKAIQTTAQQSYSCMKTKSDGTSFESSCYQDVPIAYDDYTGSVTARLSASVRIVDVASGQQIAMESIESVATDSAHYVSGYRTLAGSAFVPLPRTTTDHGITVDASLTDLQGGKQTLNSDDQMAKAAVADLAARSAKVVLGAVDVEKAPADPTTLAGSF